MNKKILIIGFICLLLIGGGLYYYYSKNSSSSSTSSSSSNVSYKESSYDTDFSGYPTKTINLDNESGVVNITSKGVYTLTGTLNGYIKVNTTENVEIILDNAVITNTSGPAIYIVSAKNTYLKLTGKSTLTDGKTYSGFDDDVKGCIYSKDDLIIFGDGTLTVNANYQDGIVGKDDLVIKSGTYNIKSADDGIRGKDSLIILDGTFNIESSGDGLKATNETDSTKGYILIKKGTFNINSALDGIQAETSLEIDDGEFNITTGSGSSVSKTSTATSSLSKKGIKAGTSLVINNITLTANTEDDSLHSNGTIAINSGELTISSGDDGIHADSSIIIRNGTINIKKSYEGIESNIITINDGIINVTSSDDGININGGNDQSAQGRPGANNYSSDDSNLLLTINGGTIKVNAGGDGLDSNGSIIMTGGTVYVDGPTDNGNGALDYNGTFKISGGTLVAAGSSGMAQNTSSGSTQNSVIIYFSTTQSAGTKVSIDGVVNYTPSKAFSSIVISSASLETNKSYDVYLNGAKYTSFTVSSNQTSVGTNNSGMKMR